MQKNKKKLLFFLLFIFILFAQANYCFGLEVPLPGLPDSPTVPQYIIYFFELLTGLGGVLAVISLAYSGIQLIISVGSPEKISDAKKRATGSVLGLVLLVGSYIMLGTINPQLQIVENTEGLKPIGGLQLTGNNKSTPAPTNVASLDAIKINYSAIYWPKTIKDLQGKIIQNCDPDNPNAVYVIYFYLDKNFRNLSRLSRLRCSYEVDLKDASSYIIVKEQPGVYFYSGKDCMPPPASNSSQLPKFSTQSMPAWAGTSAKSMRIVNGPDPNQGPFFGVVWLGGMDYKTFYTTARGGNSVNHFQHFQFSTNLPADDDYSQCISGNNFGPSKYGYISTGSYIIYKWVGLNDNGEVGGMINGGVTLYTRSAWSGGSYDFEIGAAAGSTRELASTEIYYPPNTSIPEEEQALCGYFDPANKCLQSFEIKGNFLVLVSTSPDDPGKIITGSAQVFPISPRIAQAYENLPSGYSIERGTPELASEYIGSKNAYYMEVVPLAESLVSGNQ